MKKTILLTSLLLTLAVPAVFAAGSKPPATPASQSQNQNSGTSHGNGHHHRHHHHHKKGGK